MEVIQMTGQSHSLKSDKLLVSVYARHGDTCGLADSYGHHDSLGCASGLKEQDYILVARFAYLQEAIDYCEQVGKRGVNSRLVSRIVPSAPFTSSYPKNTYKDITDARENALVQS
jgi:hypothetical protein